MLALLMPVSIDGALLAENVPENLVAEDYQIIFDRGQDKLNNKDYLGAQKEFTKVIEIIPNYWQAYHNRALSKRYLKDYKGAVKDYTKAIELNPNPWAISYYQRAFNHDRLGDYRESIADYTNALELGLDEKIKFLVYFDRGYAKQQEEDYLGAIRDYTKAIDHNLVDVDTKTFAFFFRGISKRRIKDYQGSIQDFTNTIELDSKNYESYFNRGLNKLNLDYIESGIIDLDKALEIAYEFKDTEEIINEIISIKEDITKNREIEIVFDSNKELLKKIDKAREREDFQELIRLWKKIISSHEKIGRVDSFPYSAVAYNYENLGEYKKAKEYYLKALSIEEKISGPNSNEVANILHSLSLNFKQGRIYHKEEDFDEVMNLTNRILNIKIKNFGTQHIEVAGAYQNLASLYSAKGLHKEAIKLRKLAIEITNLVSEDQDWYEPIPIYKAFLYGQISYDYYAIGDYKNSKINANNAYKINSELLDINDSEIAHSLTSLATASFATGDFQQADELGKKALKIYQKDKKQFKAEILELKKLEIILQAVRTALEGGQLKLDISAIDNLLREDLDLKTDEMDLHLNGTLLVMAGDLKRGIKSLEKAVSIIKKEQGSDSYQLVSKLDTLALAYIQKGDFKTAAKYLNESLEIFQLVFDDSRISPDLIRIYDKMAFLSFESGSFIETRQYLEQSLIASLDFIQEQAQYLPEGQRNMFAKMISSSYEALFSTISSLPNGTELALKARLNRQGLLEEIEKHQSRRILFSKDQNDLFENLKNLNSELSDISLNKEKRIILKKRKKLLEEKLYLNIPELQPRLVEINEIQNILPRNSLLIEFQKYKPIKMKNLYSDFYGQPKYLALILKSNGEKKHVELGLAEPIEAKIQQALIASEQELVDAQKLWNDLSDLLIKPLKQVIGDAETLFISPDAELNRIPFAALSSHRGNELLGEEINLRLLTTGRELLDLAKKREATKTKTLVVANPAFNQIRAFSSKKKDELSAKNISQQRSSDLTSSFWDPLPGTSREGKAIAKITNAKLLMEEKATALAIQEEEAPKVLHIATHAFFRPDQEEGEDPLLRSGIVLAGANQPDLNPKDDGYLTALEITKLDWQGTELAVISGCESGKGEIQSGEGVYGLKRAIAVAGARSSLLSLWKVDDRATAAFMTSFYKKLQVGEGRADALAATQKEFRNHSIPGWRHPYVWAAFQLSGDWRPIKW